MPNDNYFDRRSFMVFVVAILLSFFPLWFFIPAEYFGEILRAIAAAIAAGIVYAYTRGLISGYRRDRVDYGYILVLGISSSWFAILIAVTAGWYRIAFDGSYIVVNNILMSFAVWLFILGGILHLTAQDAIDGYIPRSHWLRISTYIVLGTIVGLLVLRFVVIE